MRTTEHRRVRRHIDAHLDDELSPAAASTVRRHLDECRDCARHAVVTARIKQVLRRLASPT